MIRKTTIFRRLTAIAPAICALGFAFPVLAQQAGTYAGQSADGNNISFTVTESGGVFTLGGASVGFTADCKHPAGSVSEGWGFYIGAPITGGNATFASHNDYYYISGTMNFIHKNSVKGTIKSLTAVFVPGSTPPTDAYFCSSPNQAFTATFQPAATAPAVKPGTAAVLTQKAKP